MSPRKLALLPAIAAVLGGAFSTAAQARGADVHWSVTIGGPAVIVPAPVVTVPPPSATMPRPVMVMPLPGYPVRAQPVHGPVHPVYGGYREPTRWDVDGDGIPNRYDRIYNPVWDRNGDGVADRRQYRHHPWGDRDHDGIPNRYDRWDNRSHGRHDERRDGYRDHERGEWRAPR